MAAFAQFSSDLDASTQQLLARGARLTELLKQPQFAPFPVEEEVASIFAGTRGYLDKIELGKVVRFEHQFLAELRASGNGILESIRDAKEIKKDTEKKLEDFLAEFVKRFS